MIIRRPTPAQIAARKFEIAKRYKRKTVKIGARSRGMAAIRLAQLTRWLDDCYGCGHELNPSERSILIVRIFSHHMANLPDMPRRVTAWIDRYAPWLDLASRERLISEVAECPIKWSADKLAWKIGLTDAKRSELKITTIGAIDCNQQQRSERRKKAKAERERTRRAAQRSVTVSTI